MARGLAPLRGFFTHNLGYKLVALALALLLWFDVSTDENTVIDYPVPLRIAVEGRDMIVINPDDVPESVEVSFSGVGKELLRLAKEDLSILKEVPGGENDTVQVTLSVADIRRPTDINVTPVAILPGQITVVTDRFVERTVLLEPIGLPLAEAGYQIVNVEVEPRRVAVRGVTSEVEPIGSLQLDLAQLENLGRPGSFEERLAITVPEGLRTVTVTPDSVTIRGTMIAVIEFVEPPAEPADRSPDGSGDDAE